MSLAGPGRIVAALAANGHLALGVDIAAEAVRLTAARGMNVLHRDVFGPLPGEGRWQTIVLLDGNIGIGGDVDALLTRAGALLAPAGRLLVETDADDTVYDTGVVRFAVGDRPHGPEFRWCFVGRHALRSSARRCGLSVTAEWCAGDRRFAELTR